ncbi:hypothetical protein [Leifsonia kafniensis]|uniref:hypothetical protein n=1 Tax=Leifsonia kafniensis TaxID=475957 RepID=UPI0031E9B536
MYGILLHFTDAGSDAAPEWRGFRQAPQETDLKGVDIRDVGSFETPNPESSIALVAGQVVLVSSAVSA